MVSDFYVNNFAAAHLANLSRQNSYLNGYFMGQSTANFAFEQAKMMSMPYFGPGDPGPAVMDYPMFGGMSPPAPYYGGYGCCAAQGFYGAGYALGNVVGAPFRVIGSVFNSIF